MNLTAAFYAKQRKRLLRYFTKRGVPSHDAEDLFQEAWYRLARADKDGRLDESQGIEGYLTRTATRLLIDRSRREDASPVDSVAEYDVDARPIELQPDRPRGKKRRTKKGDRR